MLSLSLPKLATAAVTPTLVLTLIQGLFFPRREKRVVTEQTAVVNVSVFLTVLVAVVGLFVMVGPLMLGIEPFVFPEDLIANWPTLGDPTVRFADLLHTAAFVSTVGVLTGALAGGLESRTVVRHLALFHDRP